MNHVPNNFPQGLSQQVHINDITVHNGHYGFLENDTETSEVCIILAFYFISVRYDQDNISSWNEKRHSYLFWVSDAEFVRFGWHNIGVVHGRGLEKIDSEVAQNKMGKWWM